MKLLKALASAVLITAFGASAQKELPDLSAPVPRHENRAIWMTPFLSSNWPSSAIVAANAESHKRILRRQLDRFAEQNINVLHYHVRANCDANYNSAYEPWSAQVGGSRGTAPAFDPFAFIIEEAHARGLEVYAWVNPYRYANNTSATPYGAGDLNYENSHPEWLLRNSTQTVLNPGIEAVQQRVVDIVRDIVSKYDIDGMIFDDYFYGQGGTDFSADAEQYQAYCATVPESERLGQADWRRSNINDMVRRVHKAIKELKPWVAFEISPAGVSSPTNIRTEYGLEPYAGLGDFQYDAIYSDPLAWLKAGTVDFLSPQVYWPGHFDALSAWWQGAAAKFGRDVYPAIDITDISTVKTAEFLHEVNETRVNSPLGASGIGFFQYGVYVNYYENVFGERLGFGYNLKQGVYPTRALPTRRYWEKQWNPVMTSNVHVDGDQLVWTAVDGMRYSVYAMPNNMSSAFRPVPEFLRTLSYTNSYTLPADHADYTWYVAVVDRFGNEYSPLQAGAAAGEGTPAELVYPADGETPIPLFDFSWKTGPAGSIVEISEDAEFTKPYGSASVDGNSLSMGSLRPFEPGKTYYWRVRTTPVNAPAQVSAVRSFTAPALTVTSPVAGASNVAVAPEVSWTAAPEGTEYTLEIAHDANFNNMDYTVTSQTAIVTVPEKTLVSGRRYYARVTAVRGSARMISPVCSFTTVDVTDYTAPRVLRPAKDGDVLYSDDLLEVEPWSGMNSVTINISATSSFPTRSSFNMTLSDFKTSNEKKAGDVKLSSKALVSGQTYYIRTRGSYYLSTSTAMKYTPYSEVRTFVYSSESGVDDITADNGSVYLTGDVLHTPAGVTVRIYSTAGVLVHEAVSDGTMTLPALVPGAYILRAGSAPALKVLR